MKIEIKHHLDSSYDGGVAYSEKTWSIFGIVVKRLIYNYPKNSKEIEAFALL